MRALREWAGREPVLTRVGPVVLLIAGYLVTKGWMDETTQELVVGIATILVGGGAITAARAKVWPELPMPSVILDLLRADRSPGKRVE